MPYDRQSIRWSFLYEIVGTEEVAVTSIHSSGVSGWTGAAAAVESIEQSDLAALAGVWMDQYGVTGYVWANYSRFVAIKVAAIDTAGHYISAPVIWEDPAPTSGEAGNVLPQATVVASMRSPSSIGDANYGRMYLPHSQLTPTGTTPFGSVSAATTLAGVMADFVDALGTLTNSLDSTSLPAIMSSKGSGTAKAITRVAVDTVTDTQRRRRNRLVGSYQFANVP